jgi:lipoic acid synthetase
VDSAELNVRRPEWMRIKLLPSGRKYFDLRNSLRALELHTVCEEAKCPNKTECWESGTATIMIMGDRCSRRCKFCSVRNGRLNPLDPEEPFRVATAIKKWGLKYVVVTSVCRDDLLDGGAEHFANTVRAIRSISEGRTTVEPLIPDFQGNYSAINKIVKSGPQVVSHNLETVKRLSPKIRDLKASYELSLKVLKTLKEITSSIYTKSSLMLGLGESQDEVVNCLDDLRAVGVDIVTMGQYLQPDFRSAPVFEYVSPDTFEVYKDIGYEKGFKFVVAGPFVRSSYRAGDMFFRNVVNSRYVGRKE